MIDNKKSIKNEVNNTNSYVGTSLDVEEQDLSIFIEIDARIEQLKSKDEDSDHKEFLIKRF
jgi:hypothetical protein